MLRLLQIFGFHLRTIVCKSLFLAVFFPLFLVTVPYLIARDRCRIEDFWALFNPSDWQGMWETTFEEMVGCRYYVVECTHPTRPLPPYSYMDKDKGFICCLFLDDAIQLNLTYGGTLTRKPFKTLAKNNAKRRFSA